MLKKKSSRHRIRRNISKVKFEKLKNEIIRLVESSRCSFKRKLKCLLMMTESNDEIVCNCFWILNNVLEQLGQFTQCVCVNFLRDLERRVNALKWVIFFNFHLIITFGNVKDLQSATTVEQATTTRMLKIIYSQTKFLL